MKTGTIFALASGGAPAGIAVIRVSGSGAAAGYAALVGRAPGAPRRLMRVRLRDRARGEELDDGLAVWFPGPASFTGEDVVEFHVHGGRAVVTAILDALSGLEGYRLAEPGEFTRRAFENGRMDLTAAEGLADLVAAETAGQRRQALRQMGGVLRDIYEAWRERLLGALAHLEAAIDFSDEELPENLVEDVGKEVRRMHEEISAHLSQGHGGERLRDGIHVAIIGPPNAGKSSLLNRLAKRDAAIVAETAGTTRDIIEVRMDLAGMPVILADTAGLRLAAADAVEDEGIRRAQQRAREADLRLAVFDATAWPVEGGAAESIVGGGALVVVNKIDLGRPAGGLEIAGRSALAVSARTGEGLDDLETTLVEKVAGLVPPAGAAVMTRARHRESLNECKSALGRFLQDEEVELAAEDLRLATRALGRITGRVDVEDMLDVIFRDFCIGK